MSGDRPPSDGNSAAESGLDDSNDTDEQLVASHPPSEPPNARPPDGDDRRSHSTRAPNTLVNALVGAAVTVITAFFVPLSPVLGGAIAGYLEGANADSGLRVGALSGIIALLPLLVIVPFVLLIFVFEPIAAISILFVLAIIAGFLAVYTVGFGALGGVLGVYLYDEFRVPPR